MTFNEESFFYEMRKNVAVCAPLVNIKKLFQFTYVKSPGNVFFCVCVCRDIAIKKCYFTWRWIKFFHSVCNWILMAIAIAEKAFSPFCLLTLTPLFNSCCFYLVCFSRARRVNDFIVCNFVENVDSFYWRILNFLCILFNVFVAAKMHLRKKQLSCNF